MRLLELFESYETSSESNSVDSDTQSLSGPRLLVWYASLRQTFKKLTNYRSNQFILDEI